MTLSNISIFGHLHLESICLQTWHTLHCPQTCIYTSKQRNLDFAVSWCSFCALRIFGYRLNPAAQPGKTNRQIKQRSHTALWFSPTLRHPISVADYVIKTRGLKPQYDNCPGNAQCSDWNVLPARGSMVVLFVSICTKRWGWLSWSSLILMWFSLWLEQQVVVRDTRHPLNKTMGSFTW